MMIVATVYGRSAFPKVPYAVAMVLPAQLLTNQGFRVEMIVTLG